MPPGNRNYFYIRILLFAVYFINGVIYINNNSVTSDEGDHIGYGMRVLKGHPEKVYFDDASTLPISALNAIPRAIEQLIKPGLQKNDGGVSDIIQGRYISLLLCFFAALLVFRWSRELYGEEAGLFSLFFFIVCPNINGLIPLVATDAFAMLFVLSSAYYFRKFILSSNWSDFILFSVHLSLAQISKQSLILLYFLYGALALIILFKRGFVKNLKVQLLRLLVLLLISIFIINAAFLFNGTGDALADYQFKSTTFRELQGLAIINKIPLPLPVPFVEGFDQVNNMLKMGSGEQMVSPRSYILGTYFTGNEQWYYYLVVILFKTPLFALLLIILAVINYFRQEKNKGFYDSAGFPLLVVHFFLLSVMLLNRSQHGLRHLLMVYPLCYICIGQLFTFSFFKKKWVRLVLVLYSLTTFYFYFPNLIAYTNELIPKKQGVYRVLDGTTIDHFQAAHSLTSYLKKHPDVQLAQSTPAAGKFVISVNDYLDLKETGQYKWLRNFEPYGHVNYCYLLIQVQAAELRKKQ